VTSPQQSTLTIADAEVMHQLGLRIAGLLRAGDLLILTGPLGAGKTTLSRGIGEGLGVIGTVSSPTFVIARTHKRTDGGPELVHVDAYRLGSPQELDDLDIDFGRSITLIEWGKGFTEGISDSWLDVVIDRDRTGATEVRTVTITGNGPRWDSGWEFFRSQLTSDGFGQ
jgi:tRNA threonylcarbamoyl adenosine modification protein YjeE